LSAKRYVRQTAGVQLRWTAGQIILYVQF